MEYLLHIGIILLGLGVIALSFAVVNLRRQLETMINHVGVNNANMHQLADELGYTYTTRNGVAKWSKKATNF